MSAAKRRRVMAGNWKMYKTARQAEETIRTLAGLVRDAQGVEVVICPPFTALPAAVEAARGTGIGIGAQDCHWEKEGAYTGEVAASMIADLGCSYCIVGHSERRQHFGDTDEMVNRKVKAVLAAGLRPIMCVGETLAEREAGRTFAVVETQVLDGLAGFPVSERERLVIAYEPVWAIGTGKTATRQQAQEVHRLIRDQLSEVLGTEAIHILYGGSVTPDNAATLLAEPDIDGALVGGASLKAGSFLGIVAAAQ